MYVYDDGWWYIMMMDDDARWWVSWQSGIISFNYYTV